MNNASTEIVAKITDAIVFPSIGCTLTQEEADAIKEYVQTRFFEDNIQGAVHSSFKRGVKPQEKISMIEKNNAHDFINELKGYNFTPSEEERILDLLWKVIPTGDEDDDPVSEHNADVITAYIYGKELRR
jgi:hypothetical protein